MNLVDSNKAEIFQRRFDRAALRIENSLAWRNEDFDSH
jgi:hypothetical protein